MKYNLIELKNDEDVKAMWKSFHRRLTKGPIELDAEIRRSVDDIMKCLIRPESSRNAQVFMFSCFMVMFVVLFYFMFIIDSKHVIAKILCNK